jgi:hypothetical protein
MFLLSRSILCLIVFGSAVGASTIVSATSTCTFTAVGTGEVLYSSGGTATGSSENDVDLGACVSPYGTVNFHVIDVRSNFAPDQDNFSAILRGGISGESASLSDFLVSGSLRLQLTSKQMYIATGGTGTGFIQGSFISSTDSFNSADIQSQRLITPIATCDRCSTMAAPEPFSFPFVFGKPFAFDVLGDLSFITGPGGLPGGGADIGIAGIVDGVFDSNGNRVATTFTIVPEPGSLGLFFVGTSIFCIWQYRRR